MGKTDCEFQARCIKNHQDAGVMKKKVQFKVLGDDRTTGYICGWQVCGTVLGCGRWKKFSVQTESEAT